MTSSNHTRLLCQNELCVREDKTNHELFVCHEKKEGTLERYFWAQTYRCPACNAKFYGCTICFKKGDVQNIMLRSMLYRHHRYHDSEHKIEISSDCKRLKT